MGYYQSYKEAYGHFRTYSRGHPLCLFDEGLEAQRGLGVAQEDIRALIRRSKRNLFCKNKDGRLRNNWSPYCAHCQYERILETQVNNRRKKVI